MLISKSYKNSLLIASVLTCLTPSLSLAAAAAGGPPPPPKKSMAEHEAEKAAKLKAKKEADEKAGKRPNKKAEEIAKAIREAKAAPPMSPEEEAKKKKEHLDGLAAGGGRLKKVEPKDKKDASGIGFTKPALRSVDRALEAKSSDLPANSYADERKIIDKFLELANQLDDSKLPDVSTADDEIRIRHELDLAQREISKLESDLKDKEKIKNDLVESYKTTAHAKNRILPGPSTTTFNSYLALLSRKNKEKYTDDEQKLKGNATARLSGVKSIEDNVNKAWDEIDELKNKISFAVTKKTQLNSKKAEMDLALAILKDPKEKVVKKLETILKQALVDNPDKEVLTDLVRAFAHRIRKEEVSEVLLDSVFASKNELIKYLNKLDGKKDKPSDEDGEISLSFTSGANSKLFEELREKNALIEQLQLELAKLRSSSNNGLPSNQEQAQNRAQAQSIRREYMEKGGSTPVSYSRTPVKDENGNIIGQQIEDDFTGDKALMSNEAAEEFFHEDGSLKIEQLKVLFDGKYTDEAVNRAIDKPKDFKEIIEDLKNQAVDLSEFEVGGAADDAIAATLGKKEQALAFLASLRDSSSKEIESSTLDSVLSFTIPEVANEITAITSSAISQRLDFLSGNTAIGVGAGAGDEDDRGVSVHGAWISGVYASSEQKMYNKVFGYKSKTSGGTVGIDFAINDNMLAGLAYGNLSSTIKGKSKGNNHIRAKANVISLYGKIDLNDKFDLGIVLSGNKTEVNHKHKKLTGLNSYTTAKGKFHTTGFNVESLLSYRMAMDNGIVASPNVGFKYGHQGDSNFTESGTGVHNLSVATKHNNEFVGMVGTKVSKQFLASDVKIVPSLNASIEDHFNAKAQKIKANYTWAAKTSEQTFDLGKPAKLAYNLGGNIIAVRNNLEVSVDYNCRFKKKYVGHKGTLKVKVLF